MLLPISGKNGFLIWNSEEIPIYQWRLSEFTNYTELWHAASANLPDRNVGTMISTLTLMGVDFIPPFYNSVDIINKLYFSFGWIDLIAGVRRIIDIASLVLEYVLNFTYSTTPQPTYTWTLTLMLCSPLNTEIIEEPLSINDRMVCQEGMCSRIITSSDITLPGGLVNHVVNATVTSLIKPPLLYLSNTDGHPAETLGIYDTFIDFRLQGDFDYWLSQVDSNSKHGYSIFYDLVNFFVYPSMKVLNIDNIVTNLQTAEIVSADVRLGAA